jgi:hypothetical protein
LLKELAQGGMRSPGSSSGTALAMRVTKMGAVLNQPLVAAWLESNMSQLTPSKVRTAASSAARETAQPAELSLLPEAGGSTDSNSAAVRQTLSMRCVSCWDLAALCHNGRHQQHEFNCDVRTLV